MANIESFSCPLPKLNYDTIQLAHGAGGKLSAELIEAVFLPCFANDTLSQMEDQAIFTVPKGRLAFSTDTFVVSPLFFPGGNIGDLAVNGTVNDVAMSGAVPKFLSIGFVLEEGLPIEELQRVVDSARKAADQAGVQIVTGDTKVVEKGSCDKLFINTSGIGILPEYLHLGVRQIRPDDRIIISGTVADHGMAILTKRKGLSFQSGIQSDTAALNDLIRAMLESGGTIHALRDPTRGGVATTLNEFASRSRLGIRVYEETIPINEPVRGACEILGIDPLYVANEGKLIAAVAAEKADLVLQAMRNHPLGAQAAVIGKVTEDHPQKVVMESQYGTERIIDMPVGEQLPRIC